MALAEKAAAELTGVKGPILAPSDPDYKTEISAFNVAIIHTPEVVVGVANTNDVVEVVRFARKHNARVNVHCTGHGADTPITSGIIISTQRINQVKIDSKAHTGTFGAGVRWTAVIAEAATHGLFPIVGAAPGVGAVGYLLGGGLGPIARSHGISADYLVSAQVVTGAGDIVEASATQNADLFWALRGGKRGFGVVTEMTVRLVELRTLYAGALLFEEVHAETVLRAWATWTQDAHPQVTSSVSIMDFPPLDVFPPPLRGRRILTVRFAYPGTVDEGSKLAAPLRAAAPVYIDTLGELPVTEIGKIHNDPDHPTPVWNGAQFLTHFDQDVVPVFLKAFEKGTSPFALGEIRHLGGATLRHQANAIDEGAVGGRGALFGISVYSMNPAFFATESYAALKVLREGLTKWATPETNINFLEAPLVQESVVPHTYPWASDRLAKLRELRKKYDPSGILSQFC